MEVWNAHHPEAKTTYRDLRQTPIPHITNKPAAYDYAPGYYAVFFRDPDAIRIELAHIPTPSNAPVAD